MMAKIIVDAKSEDWLAKRRQFVTGTEMPILLGLNKYRSIRSIVNDKLENKIYKIDDNDHMKMGRILESAVIQAFNEDIMLASSASKETNKVVMFTFDHLAATLDAVVNDKNKHMPLECKTTTASMLTKWRQKDTLPHSYLCQLMVQIVCMPAKEGYLAIMDKFNCLNFYVLKVFPTYTLMNILVEEAKRFWKCLENKEIFRINKELTEYFKEEIPKLVEVIYDSTNVSK